MRSAWFCPNRNDSRRALTSNTPAAQPPGKQIRASSANHHTSPTIGDAANNEVQVAPNPLTGVTQVAQRTGRQVVVDLAQDSDEDNAKASKGGSKKDPMKDKDGYNHCRLFFFPPGKGPKQDPTNQAWACRWCPKEYIASGSSYHNLKAHRDGAMIKGCLRGACTGRQKAIQAGSHIPLSVSERNLAKAQGHFLLQVAFGYTANTAQLHSRVWAAAKAHQLYLEQQARVFKEIKDSNKSKLSLVSDVWTTKGSHKAFIGMTACYITPDWSYKCHHPAIKYISWHHNGKYLATPFANVLVKHGLHHKITHTTDSGSNNFTMAKGVGAIFRKVDSTYWDVEKNHHRCICHVIALILGAGLKAHKLSTGMVRPEKTNQSFPLLYTICQAQ
ncbi:hypothetical protein Pst134EB_020160 [Puccinia striiformis f. sp. tritici]|nr:hypothetical protein Pst134EB_020160 [Puccinia striiformis f. sp. tritici]